MLQYGYQSQKEVVNLHACSLSEVLHGFNFLLQDLLLRSCFSPCAIKKFDQYSKNFRATLFFRASASYAKIPNNKIYIFSTVNSEPPLFFRARQGAQKN